MGLGTREDAMSDAIEQINRMVLEELPDILLRQLTRADTAKFLAKEELKDLRKIPDAKISDEDLKNLDLSNFGSVIVVHWKIRYVRLLLEFNHLRAQIEIADPDNPDFSKMHSKSRTIQKALKDFEDAHEINRYSAVEIHRHSDEALLHWIRDIKNDLRTSIVLEKYYRDRKKTYRKNSRITKFLFLKYHLVGYKTQTTNNNQLNSAKEKSGELIGLLNDILLMRNPQTKGRIQRKDCDLSKWSFWSDQKSSEHIQFAAHKCLQRIKRAEEEEKYTQQEILSVLKWCSDSLDAAKKLQESKQGVDYTNDITSQGFYNEKVHQAQERLDLWEEILRPHVPLEEDGSDLWTLD